ncbi:MAG: PAS domain S-box protein [Nitrospinae bacterium]|nr:PAS domain S-box protein [Nitrospinota bacterium]
MESAFTQTGQQELLNRVKALMFLRVLVVTGFLGAILAFQKDLELPNIVPVSTLIAATYLLTLFYAIALKWVRNLTLFCYFQIAADVFIEGGVIYITGGIDSPFSILFNFSIISSSITISKKGGYIIASLSAIIFGALLDLEYYQLLHPIHVYPPSPMSEIGGYVFSVIYLNFCAFFIIAFLSGFLAGKLRTAHEELIEKSDSLEELQAYHENVVRHMGDGLLTTGADWKISSFNYAAERITAFRKEEARGSLLPDFFPFLKNRIPLDFLGGFTAPLREEGKITRKDGEEVDVGINLSVLFDQRDQAKGCIAVFQDLTYLKDMERKLVQTERLAAVGQMSASIAHEVRNPLASLSGSVQVLRGELTLSGPNARLMDIIVEETERLNQFISQFLDYANPKPPELADAEIASLARDTVDLLKNSREFPPGVEIELELKNEGALCRVDPRQIKQVLWNVCLNGIQAMPEGGRLKITIGEWNASSPGGSFLFFSDGKLREGGLPREWSAAMLKIDIKDEGIGISNKDKLKIFEPFFSTKEKGTGLGLATVYRVIEKHNGLIAIESGPSRGTTFSIFLPAVRG